MIVVRFITAMTKIKLLAAIDERQIILFTLIALRPRSPTDLLGYDITVIQQTGGSINI